MGDTTITGWRKYASMEPLAFTVFAAFSISDSVISDLIVYQTCKMTEIPGLNKNDCYILHEKHYNIDAAKIAKLVQPHTSLVFTLQSCILTIFPTILSVFLGPWSDKYGRKPLLIYPFIGLIFSFSTYAFLSNFNLNPYWYLIPSVPAALFGGLNPILMSFFCYITDITNTENRAWHLACLETTSYTGIFTGILLGPVVFKFSGYTAVFLLSASLCAFGLLYTIFCVKETIHNENRKTFGSIFDYSLVKELFKTVIKKRDGFDRCLVWCCIFAISLHVVIFEGNNSISFLFASAKLGWNLSDYSIYAGTHLFISVIGMLLMIKFVGSVLKLPDIAIIVLSCFSNIMGCTAKAFVWKPWHMYLCSSIGMFSGTTIPVIRAVMTKSVTQKDVGKVFSVTTTIELLVPFATTPVYIYLYTHTLNSYPCPVWFLSAVIPIFIIVLAVIIEKRWKRLRNTLYVPVTEEN